MAGELDYSSDVIDVEAARRGFACCDDEGRTFTKHYLIPSHYFDPDYSMVECRSCGAVLTVGDYWGQHALDEDRARKLAPYKSHDEAARSSPKV